MSGMCVVRTTNDNKKHPAKRQRNYIIPANNCSEAQLYDALWMGRFR